MIGLTVAVPREFNSKHRKIVRDCNFYFFFRPRTSRFLIHGIDLLITLATLSASRRLSSPVILITRNYDASHLMRMSLSICLNSLSPVTNSAFCSLARAAAKQSA